MKKRSPTWLSDLKSNTFSQIGEDGIIEKILEIISEKNKYCVEFGAWDGKYLSNTRNLIVNKGFSAILIEGSKAKFEELEKNYLQNQKVVTLNKFVGFGPDDNLDEILGDTPTPVDFDFLSIDIDGNDYHVWKAMKRYRPKIVVVEFNPTIPTEVEFVQKADHAVNQGSSLLAMTKLAKEKGYELVAVLPFNAFFVRRKYFNLFKISDNNPRILRTIVDDVTYLFVGYDGRILLQGAKRMPWHGIRLKESKMQVLPGFLQKHPNNYNRIEHRIIHGYRIFSNPGKFLRKVYSFFRS